MASWCCAGASTVVASRIAPYANLVGRVPDREVAALAGVTRGAVQHWRARRGMPPCTQDAAEPAPVGTSRGGKRTRAWGRASSAWIRPGKRWAIYARDQGECAWCGAADACESLDHIWPRERRAFDNAPNDPAWVVTACLSCNRKRKALRLSAWLRRLRNDGHDMSAVLRRLVRRWAPLSYPAGEELRARLLSLVPLPEWTEDQLAANGCTFGADGAIY